ncbi:MAG: penicillin-binding protein 2 [Holosporales bacterium]|jgi:penicillin-binding protein 2|nr:penicillin-binding protein 2 [Holosporales bacterium]
MSQYEEKRIINKRISSFIVIEIFLCITVLVRLGYIQIFKFTHYKLLSDKNRLVAKHVLPHRGRILDCTGEILAKNKVIYSASLDLLDTTHERKKKVVDKLAKEKLIDEKTAEEVLSIDEKINNSNRFVLLQENLNWETLSKYCIVTSRIPEITIEKSQSRYYQYPEEFAHVIGYTSAPTKEDIKESGNVALALSTAKIGKNCVEKQYNSELFGRAGLKHIEVNSKRQFVRQIDSIDAIPGRDIQLTINLSLQREVYELLSAYKSASCVVINVKTGAILAMVSYPGYDTNIFTRKVSQKDLDELYENPYKPALNKIISGLYSPGSVFKMITALAGLKSGVIDRHTRFDCQGHCELGGRKFHCWKWKYGGHGPVNLQEAIAESCDVYFYNIARLLKPEDIYEVANDFCLGKITGIDLPGEKQGLIPTKSWKKEKKRQTWTAGDTFNMAIGQGFVLATPIQLAVMTAILANGLYQITPHLVVNSETKRIKKLNYNPAHIKLILDGMYNVVNAQNGTAFRSAIDDESFKFGGKTGSSQVSKITEQQRKAGQTISDDFWRKEHAIFVGYAPTSDPQIAVSVLVEHGESGSRTAAPIAKAIFLAARKYGQITN